MAQPGKVVQAALVRIEYTLDDRGLPKATVADQENPQPRLTIMTGTEITNGRVVLGEELHGVDNNTELGAVLRAWQVITESVQARLHIR